MSIKTTGRTATYILRPDSEMVFYRIAVNTFSVLTVLFFIFIIFLLFNLLKKK